MDNQKSLSQKGLGEGFKAVVVFVLLLLTPIGLIVLNRFHVITGEKQSDFIVQSPNTFIDQVDSDDNSVKEVEEVVVSVNDDQKMYGKAFASVGSAIIQQSFWNRGEKQIDNKELQEFSEQVLVQYASFTNRDQYMNLKTLKPLVTSSMWNTLGIDVIKQENQPEESVDYYAVTTVVESSEMTSRSDDVADVKILTMQLVYSELSQTEEREKVFHIGLVKQGSAWLVDSIQDAT